MLESCVWSVQEENLRHEHKSFEAGIALGINNRKSTQGYQIQLRSMATAADRHEHGTENKSQK